jgi:hypothetical protein
MMEKINQKQNSPAQNGLSYFIRQLTNSFAGICTFIISGVHPSAKISHLKVKPSSLVILFFLLTVQN